MTTNPTVSYITSVGQQQFTAALGGTTLKISGAAFGSDLLTNTTQTYMEGLTSTVSNSAPGTVYVATSTQVQYNFITTTQIQFRVTLGADVGTFNIGNWGLLDSNNNLISITALGAIDTKTASSSSVAGDNRVYAINITLSEDVISNLDLSVISLGAASLPEVTTDSGLPSPSSSPYPVYHVQDYQSLNYPALASRINNTWYYYLPYAYLQTQFLSTNEYKGASDLNGISMFWSSALSAPYFFYQSSSGQVGVSLATQAWAQTYVTTEITPVTTALAAEVTRAKAAEATLLSNSYSKSTSDVAGQALFYSTATALPWFVSSSYTGALLTPATIQTGVNLGGSANITVPVWATRVVLLLVGGGGGGAGCQASSLSASVSGAGGGSGAVVYMWINVAGGGVLNFTLGAGGPQSGSGGTTSAAYNGIKFATASGGGGGNNYVEGGSSGGSGGTPSITSGTLLLSLAGSCGSDGQAGQNMIFAGNGAPGLFGCGAGRAGASGGVAGSAPGAGGGGAYDQSLSNTAYNGGAGAPGTIIYRFLP